MRALVPLLVLSLAAVSGTVDDAARDALAAARGEDPAELRTLAQRDEPDPWLVAAAMCALGEFEAAEKFARAAPRADTARLPDAVEAWKKAPVPEASWRKLVTAPEGDAAALEDLSFPEGSLGGILLLARHARQAKSPPQLEAAAKAANEAGWLRLAAELHHDRARALEHAGEVLDAAVAASDWLDVETRRGIGARLPAALLESGRLHFAAGKTPEAEDLLRRALRQAQRDGQPIGIARAEALLGRVLVAGGARQDGRAYLLRAREALKNEPHWLLDVLETLIFRDRDLEGIDAGIARAEELLAVARKHKSPAAEAAALEALGRLQLERKDFREALARFGEAEAQYVLAKEPLDAARVGEDRGSLALRMGRLDEAAAALRTALEQAGPEGPARLRARIHASLGEWAVEAGAVEEAEKQLAAAAKLAKEINDRALAARTLARRGRLQLRRGEWDAARKSLSEALDEERSAGREADAARTLADLAEIDLAQGRAKEARARAAEAIELARTTESPTTLARATAIDAQTRLDGDDANAIIDRVRAAAREALTMQERARTAGGTRFHDALDRLLRVATDAAIQANDATTLLTAGEFGRSRAMLNALGGRGPLMDVMTPSALADKLKAARKREEDAVADYEMQRERMARDAMLAAKKRVQSIREEIDGLEKSRLEALSPARWLLSPGVPALDDLEDALQPTETLLYYCVGTRRAAVLKVTSSGAAIVDLGDLDAQEQAIARLREALQRDDPFPALKAYGEHELVRFGLTPGRDLVLVTAHPFDHVPFAAVAPEQTVRYASSAADVVRLAAKAQPGTGILGIGNPDFGNDEVRLRLVHLRNGIPLRRLETAATIAEEFSDTMLLGEHATEARFRTALAARSRWRAVHFAVPGLLDAGSPYRTSLALAPSDDDDGILTAYELLSIRIPADLVVLAACEPAAGTRDVDRAIQGMTQALHLAGSTRVIVSQWWVDDEAASTLMKAFYTYWAEGETSAPLALRRAQQRVSSLPGWVHPKAWAGWQVWGGR